MIYRSHFHGDFPVHTPQSHHQRVPASHANHGKRSSNLDGRAPSSDCSGLRGCWTPAMSRKTLKDLQWQEHVLVGCYVKIGKSILGSSSKYVWLKTWKIEPPKSPYLYLFVVLTPVKQIHILSMQLMSSGVVTLQSCWSNCRNHAYTRNTVSTLQEGNVSFPCPKIPDHGSKFGGQYLTKPKIGIF